MAVHKAKGGTCVVCRRTISRGSLVENYGGFLRHLGCRPSKDVK